MHPPPFRPYSQYIQLSVSIKFSMVKQFSDALQAHIKAIISIYIITYNSLFTIHYSPFSNEYIWWQGKIDRFIPVGWMWCEPEKYVRYVIYVVWKIKDNRNYTLKILRRKGFAWEKTAKPPHITRTPHIWFCQTLNFLVHFVWISVP